MKTPHGPPLKGDTTYEIQQMNEWKDIIKIRGDQRDWRKDTLDWEHRWY